VKAVIRIQRRQIQSQSELPVDLHPVLRRVYSYRKIRGAEELDHTLIRLHKLELLSGIQAAATQLADCVMQKQRIVIVGDFDADGATSAALAVRALRAMGAHDTRYIVPNRFEYGYGLTPEIVQVAHKLQPAVLVTVDNGISSIEGVQAAQQLGIRVIITDHHLPGRNLPAADAIVNPNLQDDAFPSKYLAGVGVIFYVLSAVRAELRRRDWFAQQKIAEPNMACYLDLVALGTVADVVPLDHNNRILVEQGLKRIRAGACVPAITALLQLGNRNPSAAVATDLAFAVAPRLNAAGRLEDMSLGIECLLSDDATQVKQLAAKLNELNDQRREIGTSMEGQAMQLLQEQFAQLDAAELPAAVCVYDKRWHQGVIGILAARIKEHVHRPVIAFADAGNGELKGSARSVQGVHIRDALDAVATRHPQLITKFGGHAMAAGLSLQAENLYRFSQALAEHVAGLPDVKLEAVVLSDGELAADELTLATAAAIRDGGPWGQGFPEPVFDGTFVVRERRVVGDLHLKLVLQLPGTQATLDAIAFNEQGAGLTGAARVRIAYRLDVNEFRGTRSLQLNVQYIETA
jgi:single-stranded-DNA-specific exonuclease